MAKYGDPECGLLIALGNEQGYSMLDNLNVVQIDNYKDLVELCNWLITQKDKEHHIKMIAFDTVDELALIADKETIARSTEETGKKCRSIKGAFGGFNAGIEYSANNLVKPIISGLKKAGFGIWAIAHTKFKTIKEKGGLDEDGYMQLTSNLTNQMESAFGDCMDVVITGVIDRDLEKKSKKVNTPTGTVTKTQNYATDTVRKLYFRGTTLIDAGGRFSDGSVPEFMVFDKQNMGAEFIKVVEEGIEKSRTSQDVATKPTFAPVQQEIKYDAEAEETAPTPDIDPLKPILDETVAIANDLYKAGHKEILDIVKKYAGGNNPRTITELDKAQALLAELKAI